MYGPYGPDGVMMLARLSTRWHLSRSAVPTCFSNATQIFSKEYSLPSVRGLDDIPRYWTTMVLLLDRFSTLVTLLAQGLLVYHHWQNIVVRTILCMKTDALATVLLASSFFKLDIKGVPMLGPSPLREVSGSSMPTLLLTNAKPEIAHRRPLSAR